MLLFNLKLLSFFTRVQFITRRVLTCKFLDFQDGLIYIPVTIGSTLLYPIVTVHRDDPGKPIAAPYNASALRLQTA